MSYQSRLKNEELDTFFETILSLKDLDECYMYFEDICTIAELNAIAQRLKVAMLLKDKHTCQDIFAVHWRQHGHHQPREPLPALRHGWLRHGDGTP